MAQGHTATRAGALRTGHEQGKNTVQCRTGKGCLAPAPEIPVGDAWRGMELRRDVVQDDQQLPDQLIPQKFACEFPGVLCRGHVDAGGP